MPAAWLHLLHAFSAEGFMSGNTQTGCLKGFSGTALWRVSLVVFHWSAVFFHCWTCQGEASARRHLFLFLQHETCYIVCAQQGQEELKVHGDYVVMGREGHGESDISRVIMCLSLLSLFSLARIKGIPMRWAEYLWAPFCCCMAVLNYVFKRTFSKVLVMPVSSHSVAGRLSLRMNLLLLTTFS